MTHINLKQFSKPAKPIENTCIYECSTWKVFINEFWKVFFEYQKEEDENKTMTYLEIVEQLKKQREKADDLFEAEMLDNTISKYENKIEYNKKTTRRGKQFVMLENSQVADFINCLQNAKNPENIWSCLANTWLKFWNDTDNDNLTKFLSDEMLDKLTTAEATSYSWKEFKYPRTRETD